MASAARTRRKRPGLTRRMVRSTLRVGMLATAVLVGRKTAGGGRARDGQGGGGGWPEAPGGPGAAAGGGPGAVHQTDPAAVADGGHGRQADVPQQIPAPGLAGHRQADRQGGQGRPGPAARAGVAFYALLSLFPAIIAGVSIYGLVADPQTVRDQIAKLAEMLSPETAKILGQQIQQVTSGAGGALPRRNARC